MIIIFSSTIIFITTSITTVIIIFAIIIIIIVIMSVFQTLIAYFCGRGTNAPKANVQTLYHRQVILTSTLSRHQPPAWLSKLLLLCFHVCHTNIIIYLLRRCIRMYELDIYTNSLLNAPRYLILTVAQYLPKVL